MSAMAISSLRSSLNPDAPLFIPAAFRRVEDFSPEWWELVKTTAWFRDHWFRERQELDAWEEEEDDVAALLPESFELFGSEPDELFYQQDVAVAGEVEQRSLLKPGFGSDADAVLKSLSLSSPKNGATRAFADQPRYREKPMQHVSPKSSPRRAIHQPR